MAAGVEEEGAGGVVNKSSVICVNPLSSIEDIPNDDVAKVLSVGIYGFL